MASLRNAAMSKRNTIRSHYESRIRGDRENYDVLDWSDSAGQRARFEALVRSVELTNRRLLDVGCGLGDLWDFLKARNISVDYTGVDILDVVQPYIPYMDLLQLKRDFGYKLVFHGGIDIQRLLPFGTPEEVAAGTVKCLKGFRADRGGFILAPSHSVQADVPPQNILAMVEATKEWVRRS